MPPRRPDWASAPGRRRAGAVVLALHGVLVLGWLHHTSRLWVGAPQATPTTTLTWVVPETANRPAQPSARRTSPSRLLEAPQQLTLRAPERKPTPLAQAPTPSPVSAPQASTLSLLPAASAPEPGAPSSTGMGALLRNDATRQALRQVGQQPLLAERAEAATGITIQRQDTALAEGVKHGAKGDCLKGEFAGSGGGLLSLPALAYAAAAGKCATK